MDKVLGQEYEGKARINFLRDNCNAVEVNMARVLCEALCKTLSKNELTKAI